MAHGMSDKRVFSIDVETLVEQYLAYRKNDIDKETGYISVWNDGDGIDIEFAQRSSADQSPERRDKNCLSSEYESSQVRKEQGPRPAK